ncbi:MAG: 5-formyltetrahydrofolate cyclo-ligase [Methylobacteriaceae bacterium]|nr:5-formyltetrahydrofolate cyclo-ligase [Methylobacteriaceae bacterium]
MTDSAAALKARLREEVFARRDGLDRDVRVAASARIAERVLRLPEVLELEPVGAYWPMRSEVDCKPILTELVRRGRIVALSQIRHPELSWREWRPGDHLVHGGFGVSEPGPDAPEVFPHLLLVPLAAFDRTGARLGYGKGHFDRAIGGLSRRHFLLTVGLAFAAQEVEAVPVEAHDRRLDLVVTEDEVIHGRGAPAAPGAGG